MSFNPNPIKRDFRGIVSYKKNPPAQHVVFINNSPVASTSSQKHLGLKMDTRVDFDIHLNENIYKASKGICLIKDFTITLTRNKLLSIYNCFIRPYLDYVDVSYDQHQNKRFANKIESVQYNAAFSITVAVKGTSRKRIYLEHDLESLSNRHWYRTLFHFNKLQIVFLQTTESNIYICVKIFLK